MNILSPDFDGLLDLAKTTSRKDWLVYEDAVAIAQGIIGFRTPTREELDAEFQYINDERFTIDYSRSQAHGYRKHPYILATFAKLASIRALRNEGEIARVTCKNYID